MEVGAAPQNRLQSAMGLSIEFTTIDSAEYMATSYQVSQPEQFTFSHPQGSGSLKGFEVHKDREEAQVNTLIYSIG